MFMRQAKNSGWKPASRNKPSLAVKEPQVGSLCVRETAILAELFKDA